MTDAFESHSISLILAWLFSIPLLFFVVTSFFAPLFTKLEDIPKLLAFWFVLCLFVLGPTRYIILQLAVALAYPVQSFSAVLTTFLLALYMPIVFGILVILGIGVPIFGATSIGGMTPPRRSFRLVAAGIAAPFLCVLGSYLYFAALPYAAYSTHWLSAGNLIRATNGPPEYLYAFVVEQGTPLGFPKFVRTIGPENLTARERLRAHVAALYLNDREFSRYVGSSYPNLPPDH
jgi:hypothetical protein